MHAQDHDLRRGEVLDDAAGGLDAIDLRHGDIHDDDVGFEGLGQADGVGAIAGLPDDFHVGLLVEDELEALANHRVIIG